MGRFGFIGMRLLQAIPVMFGVTVVCFFILRLIPGDPVAVMLGSNYTPERAAVLRANLGLDKSLWEQYWLFLTNIVQGDLGQSIYYSSSVRDLVVERIPVTIWLAVYSTLIAITISVPLATLSALKKNAAPDQAIRGLFVLAFAMPPFWVGIVLTLLFSLHWQIFPVGGYGGFRDNLGNLFLPSLTIALGFAAILIRTLRNSILNVLDSEYLDTAKAKGLSETRILWRHVLRNALISGVTVIGVNLSYLIGSTVIIENVFALPGLGQLLAASITQRDLAVVQGITLVFGLGVVLTNLLTDVTYAVLDPRVSYD